MFTKPSLIDFSSLSALMFIIPVVTRSARHIDVNQGESTTEPPQVLSRHSGRLLDVYEQHCHVDRARLALDWTDVLLTGSVTEMPARYVACRLIHVQALNYLFCQVAQYLPRHWI